MTIINIEKWMSRFLLILIGIGIGYVWYFLSQNPDFFSMFLKENLDFYSKLMTKL